MADTRIGPYITGKNLCGSAVLEPDIPALARVWFCFQGSRYLCRKSVGNFPGVGLASPSGCVLGQLQPDPWAVRQDIDSHPHRYRYLRCGPARSTETLSGAPEELSGSGSRAALPRDRPMESRRHTDSEGGIRRTQSRAREPYRFAQAPSRLVRLDNAGGPEAGVPAEECRLLRNGRRQVALFRYAGGRHRAFRAIVSTVDQQSERRICVRLTCCPAAAKERARLLRLRSARYRQRSTRSDSGSRKSG